MSQAEQHGGLLPKVIATLWLTTVACTSLTGHTSAEPGPGGAIPTPSLSVQLPAQHLDGMHTTESTLTDAVAASLEATRPDEVRDVLTADGFEGAKERIYAGRFGVFARVVVRGWEFRDAQGASAYLGWLEQNPREWIGDSHPVEAGALPPSVTLVLHEPSGCCHEETPIYLASWQKGEIVWTIRASGPKIRTPPVLDLVAAVEGKV